MRKSTLILLLLFPLSLFGTTYYVDTDADNGGDYGDVQNNLIRNNLIMDYCSTGLSTNSGIWIEDDADVLGNTYENNIIYILPGGLIIIRQPL